MYINYFFCFIFYKYQTIPNSLYYLCCQSNKFYCFAFQKNMVHGEARAECSCFNFFPFRFLRLHRFYCFPTLCIFTYIHYGGCNDICGSDFIIRGFVYLKSILNYSLSDIPDIALRYCRLRLALFPCIFCCLATISMQMAALLPTLYLHSLEEISIELYCLF